MTVEDRISDFFEGILRAWFRVVDRFFPEVDEPFIYGRWQRSDTRLFIVLIPVWISMLGAVLLLGL